MGECQSTQDQYQTICVRFLGLAVTSFALFSSALVAAAFSAAAPTKQNAAQVNRAAKSRPLTTQNEKGRHGISGEARSLPNIFN